MEFIKLHFEKLLLAIFLLALMAVAIILVIRIGLLKNSLDLDIRKGKSIPTLNEAALTDVQQRAESPPQWGHAKRLFVAPVLALMPVPGTDQLALAPPNEVPRAPEDKDIPDPEWLKKYGLQNIAGVGKEDNDNDGFTNKEEYDYKTNPKDAQSFPAVEQFLRLDRLIQNEVKLRFKGYTKSSDGRVTLQNNIRALGHTYFNVIGEQVGDGRQQEPFKIEKFEQKSEEYFDASLNAKRQRDVSEETLSRLDAPGQIVLVLDRIAVEKSLGALLQNKLGRPEWIQIDKKNQEFQAHGKTYKVVDITEDAVLISESQSQQQFTLKKAR